MKTNKEKLIELVLDQIEKDVEDGDYTAIAEMLKVLPIKVLDAYLPEDK
jgi:hypothetical protein